MTLLILFAFVAGAGTAASPCVLPVLPAVLSASATGGRRRPLGIVIGLATTFTITIVGLGTLVGAAGLGDGALRTAAAAVLLAFGVALAIPRLTALVERPLARLGRLGPSGPGRGLASGLAVGAALGFAYAPCAGPILAAVITVGAASGRVVAIAVAYAAGSAAVLLVFALGGRRMAERIRRAGRGPALQRALGLVMVLTAVAVAGGLDVQVQTALASHFPAVLVDPAGALERSDAAQRRLTELHGAPRFAPRPVPASTPAARPSTAAATPTPEPFRLPVLGTAPEFAGTQRWFNTPGGRPLTLAGLRGKVVLVDFWTYTCINCLRTLPYVRGWAERYRRDGLVIVGVHAPEFAFERDAGNVEQAIRANRLPYPVAQDNDRATWDAWGNRSWPSKYLVDARGRVRYAHSGEGAYLQTEAAIRSLLREAGREHLGTTADVRAAETPGLATTPETYVGADRAERWAVAPQLGLATYPGPAGRLTSGGFALGGSWSVSGESAEAAAPGATIDARVRGKSVYLVLSGRGNVEVSLDGRPIGPDAAGADVRGGVVRVRRQRLYRLVSLPAPGEHRLGLRFDPGVSAFAFTFG